MTKQEILEHFKDINHAYNESTRLDDLSHMLDELMQSNSDGDCISRKAVIEIAKSSKSNWIDNSVLFKRVNDLPSVTPKPKTGHWIDEFGGCECSECGCLEEGYSDYCPNCGVRMEGETE